MFAWSKLFETKIDIVDEQHRRLFDMLNLIAAEIEHGEQSEENLDAAFDELVKFVASWLIYHTLRTDQHMAIQIDAIKKGASPEVAYKSSQGQALDPAINQKVLEAVLHLWAEAVERNTMLEKRLKALAGD